MNEKRLILVSVELVDLWATRTERGERVTVEWGEQRPEGWYEPEFTVHFDDTLGLVELRALSEAATPGPWKSFTDAPYGAEIAEIGESITVARPDDGSLIEPGDEMADAALIVAAVNYVRSLLR